MEQWDVIVIGAGVVGSAVARELARYRLRVAVLEKELDVACGNSSRNTGMLHAGFTYKPGSLKAECAVEGNKEFDQVAAELGVPFRRTGKLVVGFTEHDRENILKFKAIGEKNGVTFLFDHRVDAIERDAATDRYLVRTSRGTVATKWVVNCAGAYASMVSEMLGYPNYPVRGFKGEYFVLDKRAGEYLKVPVYPAPNDRGGFSTHATPTVDGNILVGPDSYITEVWEDYAFTKEHLDGLIRDGSKMFKQMRCEYFICNFAVARLVEVEKPEVNEDFDPVRPTPKRFYDMTREEQAAAIEADPEYGEIACRCETVTRAEIRRAILNPLGVHTVTGIKNRTRATMGRCQGGYCETRITEMIERELGIEPTDVRYSHAGSYMFTGPVRGAQGSDEAAEGSVSA